MKLRQKTYNNNIVCIDTIHKINAMVRKVLAVQKVMRSIFNFQTARTEDLDSFENYDEIYAHLDDWGLIGVELEILNLLGQKYGICYFELDE